MLNWSGRFFIAESVEEESYKVGIYLNKGDKEYRFGFKIPKESLKQIKRVDEIEFTGFGEEENKPT